MIERMLSDVERFNREVIDLPIPDRPTRLSPTRKNHAIDHLGEELDEFSKAETIEDEADALVDLTYVALGRLVEMGIVPGALFSEVHEANLRRKRGTNVHRPNSVGFDAVKPLGWKGPDFSRYMDVTAKELETLDALRKGEAIVLPTAPGFKGPGHDFIPDILVPGHLVADTALIGTHSVCTLAPRKRRILVLGFGRHGKDTAAEMLRDDYGLSFTSSSWFCAERVMMPYFNKKVLKWGFEGGAITRAVLPPFYATVQECYDDRHNHREEWYQAIRDFNTPDLTALGRAIFAEHEVYAGLRHSAELHALKNNGCYDFSIWVDAQHRGIPPEESTSCSVEPWMADAVVDNGGTLDDLRRSLRDAMARFGVRPSKDGN